MNVFHIISVAALLVAASTHAFETQTAPITTTGIASQVEAYRRFALLDPYMKRVDDRGRGYPELDGLRNMRVVLHGVYYRGGANNTHAAGHVRDNRNPLQDWALEQLCAHGFTEVVYLYTTNFKTARPKVSCNSSTHGQTELVYSSTSITAAKTQSKHERQLLSQIHEHVTGRRPGPLYVHCWNGWHASGLMAALALRQFCGWSPAQAERYFVLTAEKTANGPGDYVHLKERIRAFTPFGDMPVAQADQALMCPGAPE